MRWPSPTTIRWPASGRPAGGPTSSASPSCPGARSRAGRSGPGGCTCWSTSSTTTTARSGRSWSGSGPGPPAAQPGPGRPAARARAFPITYDDGGGRGRERGRRRPAPFRRRHGGGRCRRRRSTTPSTGILANRRPGFVPKARLSAADVAGLAPASGGVAVLAHPYSLGLDGADLARVVGDLAAGRLRRHRGRLRSLLAPPAPGARQPGPPVRPGGHRRLGPPRAGQTRPPGRHRPGRPQGAGPGARPARVPTAGRA